MAVQDYELLLRVRADLNQALGGLDNLKRKLGDGEGAATRMARSGDKASSSLRTLGRVAAAVGIAKLVSEYFQAADAAGNMAAKIRLVTDSTQAQVAAQKALFKISQETSSGLGTTTDLYVKLAQSSAELRKNQALLFDTTKLVSEALVLSGADAGTAAGVVRQFAQAMAAGVLRGDEFNSVMDGAPRLAQAMADGLGVPLGALRELAAQGKLTAALIIRALSDQKETVDREFAGLPLTVGRAMQQVKTSLLDMVGGADQASGASHEVAESIHGLSVTLSDPDVKQGFAATIKGLVDIANSAASAIGHVKTLGEVIAGTFKADTDKSLDALYSKRATLQDHRDAVARQYTNPNVRAAYLKVYDDELAKLDAVIAKAKEADYYKHLFDGVVSGVESGPPKSTGPIMLGDTSKPDKAAQATARAAVAGQQSLIESLQSLQAQLDPTAAAWKSYNDAVTKADADAAAARKGKGADIEAINAQRNAVVQLAGTVRDAALAELAKKDQQAWEQLRASLRTPAEVKLETAKTQIAELNRLLAVGATSGSEYKDALQRIATGSITAAPQYQGVDAAVGGPMAELQRNFEAADALEAWHAQQLADNEKFRNQDAANETVYQARMAAIAKTYADQRVRIESSRQMLTLTAASDFFGNLAQLQHSQNSKMAAIGKAAAVAQAVINTYQSATAAYAALAGIPYVGPALGAAAAAAAIAAGLANVAAIRSQSTGFAEGGYTGPGQKHQVAGYVHAGEVVWSQVDVKRAGGVGVVETMRLRGYADGGIVAEHPLTRAPPPGIPAFPSLRPSPGMLDGKTQPATPAVQNNIKVVTALDSDQLAQEILSTHTGERLIVHHVSRNPMKIRGAWGAG